MDPNEVPAFPRPYSEHEGCEIPSQTGMLLRDWFAGMALQGELASQQGYKQYGTSADRVGLADWCYGMADAMLKVRNGDSL